MLTGRNAIRKDRLHMITDAGDDEGAAVVAGDAKLLAESLEVQSTPHFDFELADAASSKK